MPHRFQDIGPYDFEKFMAVLFRADGYEVQETEYSGDFGADLILTKDGIVTAVQVKRYASTSLVTVGDVNQVIGATSYYKTHNALVVTTSDFTAPAITIAKSAEVFLWNWQRLEQYISTVFLNGQDYHLFYGHHTSDVIENAASASIDLFELNLLEINLEGQTSDGQESIEVRIALNNTSDRNLTVHLDFPIVISKRTHRQVTAIQWKENCFFHGVLVSEATVELACHFLKEQVDLIKPGDRMILHVHVAGMQAPVVIDEKLQNPKRNCYIVTYCYGRDTNEYRDMIRFRDQTLTKSLLGRMFVNLYYRYSPWLVQVAQKSFILSKCLRYIIQGMLSLIMSLLRRA